MSGRNWELKEIQRGLSSTVEENPNLLFYPEIWTFDGQVFFSTQMGWEKCKSETFGGLKNYFPPCFWNNHNEITRKERILMSMLHVF